jgi:hypothetical protein
MKKLAAILIAMATLSGCVVYPAGRGYDYRGDHERYGAAHRSDRDGDGVANRYDRRPDNPRRY